MTDVSARLFGLRDRGRIAPGWRADPLSVRTGVAIQIVVSRDVLRNQAIVLVVAETQDLL
jgi:alpha-D-ribose 1-methylphosphonate 5-triphosphate diphosphatase PhnM